MTEDSHTHQLARDFGERLAELRRARKMSKRQVALAAAVNPSSYGRYESGESWPHVPGLARIAAVLHANVDELLLGKRRRKRDDLETQWEAVQDFTATEKRVVRAVLEGLILKHESDRRRGPERV